MKLLGSVLKYVYLFTEVIEGEHIAEDKEANLWNGESLINLI
jgi:hypothetical protein